MKSKYNLIEVDGANISLQKAITNISKNMGCSRSALIRKEINKTLSENKDLIDQGSIIERKPRLTVSGMPVETQEKVEILTSRMSVGKSAFIIMIMNKIVADAPDHLKRPYED